ncbi:hypothetical protein [Colwellia sp. C1TZA3]|uniref:hypothetical protein n=1 Tax=Colwellia sp. C1TZA3 TaxID=2508879 RepID=UPI0011B95A97|nr:hypothetical protein [Colwellia sp. C1TZA3]TWX72207.1 hypothetical protein ESZ39_08925 [Colwellia sp. C1TZA3]
MFLLSNVLDCYKNAGLDASISILFDKNQFSGKFYLFSNKNELNQPAFNEIYSSIIAGNIDSTASSLVVESITSWVTSRLNFSVRMTSEAISTEIEDTPRLIKSFFEELPNDLFNLMGNHSIIEISCKSIRPDFFVDLILNDSYLSSQELQLINEKNKSYKLVSILEPRKKLEEIKQKKSLMDRLINKKLESLEGNLKGIRGDYALNNITYFDYSLVCLLYGFEDIDEYERSLKSNFLNENKLKTSNNQVTESQYKKLTMLTLIDDILVPKDCTKIVERIKKFTAPPLNVDKILKVEEYKFEWLQGITPEMIKSFKIFKEVLGYTVSGFSTNVTLLKSSKPAKKNYSDDDTYDNFVKPKQNTFKNKSISLKSKLENIVLTEHFNNIVTRLNKEKRTSMTVYDLLNLDNSWFLRFYDVSTTSKYYSDFLKLKTYLEGVLNTFNNLEISSADIDSASADNSKSIPYEILNQIKEWAFEGYFDDKEMYNLFVQEQTDAYLELQTTIPDGMVKWALDSVYDYTEAKYTGDFLGQLREIKLHIASYFSIESISSPEIFDELRDIKQKAREALPGNYNEQLKYIKAELVFVELEKSKAQAKKEIEVSKPNDVRTWDWENTLVIVAKKYPNDPIAQLAYLRLQINSLYDIKDLSIVGNDNEVEKLKLSAKKLFSGDYKQQYLYLLSEVENIPANGVKESTVVTQIINEQNESTVAIVPTHVNKKVKELNISAVYNKNKSEKNFLTKLSSIFKIKPTERKASDDSLVEVIVDTSILEELVGVSVIEEVVGSNNTVDELENDSALHNLVTDQDCNFIKYNKKNEIGIKVQALQSFDAFDFESMNNKLVVIINSNHPFYSKLYRDSSEESKRVIDMMISSLCHLSHLNISETVKQQDKKLFSRWSEYLEEYLLED